MKVPAFIKQLAKCCDSEASRYALGGVQMLSDGKTCQLTATDGRILASVSYDDDDIAPKPVSAIVPADDMPNAPVFKSPVSFDGTAWSQAGKTVLTSTPVEGRFPRIEDVFDAAGGKGYVAVKLDAALLAKLCALAHAMNDDAHAKGITLYVKDHTSAVFAAARSTSGHVARMAIMPRAADGMPPDGFPAKPGTAPAPENPAAESGKREPQPKPKRELRVKYETVYADGKREPGPTVNVTTRTVETAVAPPAAAVSESPASGGYASLPPVA